MIGNRFDPYGAYNFLVEIDGIIEGGFSEVSGLSIQTEVETIQEGGVNDFEHKLPKGSKYTDITLKRGLTDRSLYDWYRDVVSGTINRKSGSIKLLDHERMPVMEWRFFEAYPVKWDGPTFNAASNTVASESLVLTYHMLL
jgi:phage tail-like protein